MLTRLVGINSKSVDELIPNFFFYAHMLRGGQVLLNYFVLLLLVLVWFIFFSYFLLMSSQHTSGAEMGGRLTFAFSSDTHELDLLSDLVPFLEHFSAA